MPFRNEIIFLTFLIIALAIFVALILPPEELVAYGTIAAAGSTLLAAVWFTASLYYQSIQLKEQRIQFNVNFSYLREDAKRKAILLVKEMLNDSEEKALKGVVGVDTISELPTAYMNGMAHWKTILESEDPTEVAFSCKKWLPLETSAITFVSGVKHAAEIYFKAIEKTDIDYLKKPEDFLFIYSPLLREAPYFQTIIGVADMLAQFMFTIVPGREACTLAGILAMAIGAPSGVMKEDKIQQDIENHISKGYKLPAILNVYRRTVQH